MTGRSDANRMEEVSLFLKKLRFKRKLFGGLDEADVWKKLEELQQLYRKAFDEQNAKIRELEQLFLLIDQAGTPSDMGEAAEDDGKE